MYIPLPATYTNTIHNTKLIDNDNDNDNEISLFRHK